MHINLVGYGHAKTTPEWQPELINRIYYCLNDNGYCVKDGKTFPLQSNHAYIIPQNTSMQFHTKDSQALDHVFFDFFPNPLFQSNEIIDYDLTQNLTLKKAFEFIIAYFDDNKLLNISKYRSEKIFDMHKDLVCHFLHTLLLYLDEQSDLFVSSDSSLSKTISYIYSHYNENIALTDLCKIALLNESAFIKQFKSETGKTPYQYIKDFRLSISCSMLQANRSIKDIAESVGFQSSSSYSNSFYKKYGMYPADYRQMFR